MLLHLTTAFLLALSVPVATHEPASIPAPMQTGTVSVPLCGCVVPVARVVEVVPAVPLVEVDNKA